MGYGSETGFITQAQVALRKTRARECILCKIKNMLIIRSYKYLWRVGYYNPETFYFKWEKLWESYKNWKDEKKSILINAVGRTGKIGKTRCFLFRYNDILYFDYGKKRIKIDYDTDVKIIQVEDNNLHFKATQGNEILLEIIYKPNKSFIPLEVDFTPNISEADFDFGLNVYEMLLNKEFRKKLFKDFTYKEKMFKR